MGRGKSYNEEIKEQVRAALILNPNAQAVAEQFGLPRTTIKTWQKSWEKEDGDDSFAVLRQKKKEEFVENAWNDINTAQDLLRRRLQRAHEDEDKIDKLMDRLLDNSEEITDKEFMAIMKQLKELKISDVSKLTTVIGTLYDKQALASKDPTLNVAEIKKFEDF